MRKAALFALMLTLLLAACGGEEKEWVALQQQYAAVEAADMEAEVRCHYGDEVRAYTLRCDYTPDCSAVTVLAPEDLAGISATVQNGELTLRYEDIYLDTGICADVSMSPVAVLPKLMEAACGGYVTAESEEKLGERTCRRLSCDLQDDTQTVYTTWFDQESLLPLRSEVTCDGTMTYEVTWSRFEVTQRRAAENAGSTTEQ